MAQALPYLTLGLGVASTIQGGNLAGQAISEAKKPRYSPEQLTRFRQEGTSNIGATLAERGVLDSSLYTGALTGLERDIQEAGTETRGDPSSIMFQRALGLEQGGGQTIGNVAQMYWLNKIFGGGQNPFTSTPFSWYQPYVRSGYGVLDPTLGYGGD